MITPSPDVTEIDLIPSADEFLVIACDGVWNSMTSQEVVEFIQDRLHPPTINNSSSENTSNSHSNSGADVSKNGNDLGEVGKLDSSDQLTKICHEVRYVFFLQILYLRGLATNIPLALYKKRCSLVDCISCYYKSDGVEQVSR